ncbi:MAG: hypothetical protein S4CHLAM107_04590 [Chlamydiia bacterium]|nr:hypothetical protein [Chlamydiia bacterium]
MEALAMRFHELMANVLPGVSVPHFPEKMGFIKRMELAGGWVLENQALHLIDHSSDTVRGWVCYAIGKMNLPLKESLELMRPLADDPHFGVREWAWIALRAHLMEDLEKTLKLLTPFVQSESENLRRFAIEGTRPRGVWCAHFDALKKEPWKALELFEHLYKDPSKYVRLSLGNWLNDASKLHPDWVLSLCEKWQKQSSSPETAHICKRALRSMRKL